MHHRAFDAASLSLVESLSERLKSVSFNSCIHLKSSNTRGKTPVRRALSCSLAPGRYLQKFLGGEFLTCAGPLGSAASHLSVPQRACVCPPIRLYNGFAEMTFRIPPTGFSTDVSKERAWQSTSTCDRSVFVVVSTWPRMACRLLTLLRPTTRSWLGEMKQADSETAGRTAPPTDSYSR